MYVKQAANALEILEYFARRLRPATPAEIADDLEWPRSSTLNLVGTLVTKGYLYEQRASSGYYPSPRWLVLSEAVSNAEPLSAGLQRVVVEVARETGETTLIAAPAGTSAIFVHVEESRQPVRYAAQFGDRVPIHASSVGRALLEQMSLAARWKIYRKLDFERYSATTPLTPESVEKKLADAATRGYHRSNSEYVPDLAGVAMPVPGQPRHVSIAVVGPVSRCLEKRPGIAALLRRRLKALPKVADVG